jgi:hypothetical protein
LASDILSLQFENLHNLAYMILYNVLQHAMLLKDNLTKGTKATVYVFPSSTHGKNTAFTIHQKASHNKIKDLQNFQLTFPSFPCPKNSNQFDQPILNLYFFYSDSFFYCCAQPWLVYLLLNISIMLGLK